MSKLPIDYKVNKFIIQIQKEFKDELNIDIEYDTIVAVLESQNQAIADGMKNGDTVVLKYFGTFVATKKRVDMLNKQYARKGLTPKLEDKGLVRLSFSKWGTLKNESIIELTSKKDG